jgi:hypothetical protein
MAHHNFDYEKLRELQGLVNDAGIGATGQYPHGHYGEHDEGEIKFAIAADARNQKVLIDFGKPVHSLGLTPDQATELADLIQKKAWECRGIR